MSAELRDDDVAADVAACSGLKSAQVATYVSTIRTGGERDSRPFAVLTNHFDLAPKAEAIVRGVRIEPAGWSRTSVMLVDAAGRVIASSDGRASLTTTFALETYMKSNC